MNVNVETPIKQSTPDTFKTYIAEVFKMDINETTGFDPLSNQYTPLFDSIYSTCLDEGIKWPQKINNPEIKNETAAPGVATLSRTGAIHYIEKKGAQNFNYHFLDIADMRQADLAGAGDWLLNKIAQVISQEVETYNQNSKLGAVNNAKTCLSCRYGGDEFMVITPKNFDHSALIAKIKQNLEILPGYFLSPGKNKPLIESKPVQIKNHNIETIQPPSDPLDLKIFEIFMSRGVVLNQDQIAMIKQKPEFNKNNEFDPQLIQAYLTEHYFNEDRLYPEAIFNNVQEADKVALKTGFFDQVYPEFSTALKLCLELDNKDETESKGTLKKTRAALQFIEKVVFDRLLGDVFYSYGHIADGLEKNKYQEIWAVDSKFLKEVNDHFSYVDGDEIVQAVWKKLKSVLAEKRQCFNIARRAGTFVIALKKDFEVDTGLYQAMTELKSYQVEINGQTAELPLGFSLRPVDPIQDVKDQDWVRKQLAPIEDAETNWYDQIVDKAQSVLSSTPTVEETLQAKLLRLYFNNPKRMTDRRKKLARALENPEIAVGKKSGVKI